MSKFPITGLSSNGNRVIEKSKIDNELYFDNLDALGPNWGEAFVKPINMAFTDGATRYKITKSYPVNGLQRHGVATNGTDLFLAGCSSIRPSKYNIASDSWSEGAMAYNDIWSLYLNTGSFDYNGNLYFFVNSPDMGTDVNFFIIYKYDPVANTWTTLTSNLSSALANAQNVIYGFMGVAADVAYFMMMVKSDNASYVPAGFPTVMKYNLTTQVWSNASVTPPLVDAPGNTWDSYIYIDTMFRGNNVLSCKYSETEFLIHVKGPSPVATSPLFVVNNYIDTHEIYKYSTVTNSFTFVCRLKEGPGDQYGINKWTMTNNRVASLDDAYKLISSLYDSRIFYNGGIIFVWKPYIGGLIAYEVSSQRQFFIPMRSITRTHPIICETGGLIFLINGAKEYFLKNYTNTSTYTPHAVQTSTGLKIDIGKLAAFLTKEKTIAVNAKSFD